MTKTNITAVCFMVLAVLSMGMVSMGMANAQTPLNQNDITITTEKLDEGVKLIITTTNNEITGYLVQPLLLDLSLANYSMPILYSNRTQPKVDSKGNEQATIVIVRFDRKTTYMPVASVIGVKNVSVMVKETDDRSR